MSESELNSYQISTIGKRATAYFLDDVIVSLLLFIIFYNQLLNIYQQVQNHMDFTPLVAYLQENTLIFILLRIIYQTFFVWQNGMTPGKMIMKIRVIEMDSGNIPSFGVAFLRASIRIVSESIFYIGYIMAFFNPMVQTLHDKLAKTVVVDV
ncbi:MAG TPA: RDD family protein [Campylobacterales bacterium]|nr:RDD family protein [Campylobacterales bacterium]HHH50855.1 RDD family protein [Campylobacterales bacterium]